MSGGFRPTTSLNSSPNQIEFSYINRVLAEVGTRGKEGRFGIFPFPFNLSPFPTKVQKALLHFCLITKYRS